VERKFPVYLNDGGPPFREIRRWSFAEYGAHISPRLVRLAELESPPPVMPMVLDAWGLAGFNGVLQTIGKEEARERRKTKPNVVADMLATPAQALNALAHGPTPADRRAAANRLFSLGRGVAPATVTPTERLAKVIEEAWHTTKIARADVVAGLAETVRNDPGLLTIEIAAASLALEGEDGVTELLALCGVADSSIRSKVVLGLSLLERSARWAVPALIRSLEREPVDFVTELIVHALGRIGGRDAVAELERLLADAEGDMNWELASTIRAALEQARREPGE
jgi:hypothetical protein